MAPALNLFSLITCMHWQRQILAEEEDKAKIQKDGTIAQLHLGDISLQTFRTPRLFDKSRNMIWGLDGPIRANRFADSRESLDSRESFRGSRNEPLYCESRFGGLQIANRRSEAIRAKSLARYQNRVFFFCSANRFARIDSRESPRFALRIAGPAKIWGAPDSSFRTFALNPLQKSRNQKIKNGASEVISVTRHNSGTNHRNGK